MHPFVFLLHFAVLAVCTQHRHAVYTIVSASGLRKLTRMHKDCKTVVPDIMRGYTIYVHYATGTKGGHLKAELFVDYVRILLILLC